jgi:hypothetical protein
MDSPTLPNCKTVCLRFPAKQSYNTLWMLWFFITSEMLPPKSSENYWLMFAPCTPSFLFLLSLSKVQSACLCHLLWKNAQNLNTNYTISLPLDIPLWGISINKLSWTPYMVVEWGSWGQLVSSALHLLPILWKPTDMLNLLTSRVTKNHLPVTDFWVGGWWREDFMRQ